MITGVGEITGAIGGGGGEEPPRKTQGLQECAHDEEKVEKAEDKNELAMKVQDMEMQDPELETHSTQLYPLDNFSIMVQPE